MHHHVGVVRWYLGLVCNAVGAVNHMHTKELIAASKQSSTHIKGADDDHHAM
jgi:hypothetical protein